MYSFQGKQDWLFSEMMMLLCVAEYLAKGVKSAQTKDWANILNQYFGDQPQDQKLGKTLVTESNLERITFSQIKNK